jgi:hypothetical protein
MTHPIPSHQTDQQTIDQLRDIVAYMSENSLVMTTAESCTAGLIAAHLADVPGRGQIAGMCICDLHAGSPSQLLENSHSGNPFDAFSHWYWAKRQFISED